jgi:hypothetical protein
MIIKWLLPIMGLAPGLGCAQNYVPITAEGSRWLYHVITPFLEHYLESADVLGDTVIGGESFTVIDQMGTQAAVRDVDGQVWCWPIDLELAAQFDSVPFLLYDFNLQLGDTFDVSRPSTWHAIVAAQDTVQMLDGTSRQRSQFSFYGSGGELYSSGQWIEGVGDPFFVLWQLWDWNEVTPYLECYGISDLPLYGPCTYLGQPVVEVEDTFQILPVGDHGQVKLIGPLEKVQGLVMHDAMGRVLDANGMSGEEFNLSRYGPGIYFLRLLSSEGSQTLRFSIQGR